MDLLEKRATNLVPTLRFVDPLEVYLGLPIALKHEFQLPLNQEGMLFFTCSSLTDNHLNDARKEVRKALADTDKVHEFLIQQPKWKEGVLQRFFKKELDKIEKAKADAEDNIDEDLSIEELVIKQEEIQKAFNNSLKQLSQKAIGIERRSVRKRIAPQRLRF